jgi:hypothetical protein
MRRATNLRFADNELGDLWRLSGLSGGWLQPGDERLLRA